MNYRGIIIADKELKKEPEKLHVAYIGTYLPRKCGIATFTFDLATSIKKASKNSIINSIVAMNNTPAGYPYPKEVSFSLMQNRERDYRRAAEFLNMSKIDVVCVQHEPGIFGGVRGEFIEHLLKNLEKPVVTTMHKVDKEPDAEFLKRCKALGKYSDAIVVMSETAKKCLVKQGIPEKKVHVIFHGVHDVAFIDPNFYKDKFNVEGKKVLLTFGLINPRKGIETVIKALPKVVKKFPNIVYIVLGATHPNVKKQFGEEYRLSLQRLSKSLGVEKNVLFVNRFVELDELLEIMGACDVYVTPYLYEKQMTSGTLAYAVGMGKAVVSTPYWHAEELLDEGRGIIYDFGDVDALSKILLDLFENETKLHQLRKTAYEYGRRMTWQKVGEMYGELFRKVHKNYIAKPKKQVELTYEELPDISLNHLKRLTDNVGIIKKAVYNIPDRNQGYNTTDQARALVAIMMYYNETSDTRVLRLASVYLGFLYHAQTKEGLFHDSMNYNRVFSVSVGSEYTQGTILWALGYVLYSDPNKNMSALAKQLFDTAFGKIKFTRPRAIAYAICGYYYYMDKFEGATGIKREIKKLADYLVKVYKENTSGEWRWFENRVGYANAKIPHALLLAYQITGNEDYKEVAFKSLEFIEKISTEKDVLSLIGDKGYYHKNELKKTEFSQKPIAAWYYVDAFTTAYQLTEDKTYEEKMEKAFEWFLGRNILQRPMVDLATGACSDALESKGPSSNQGAESTTSFLVSLLRVAQHLSGKLKKNEEDLYD